MFKKQSTDSNNATFIVSVVRSKDRKVLQKGTLEATPSSIMYRGNDGSKTKLSWSLKSLRKIEATTDRLFMMDTGDTTCSLSEGGVVWFQMPNAKQVQNVILWNMNLMIQSETPPSHRSVTSSVSVPVSQTASTIASDYAPPLPPPMHWKLNTRTSVDSNSSTVSPTSSRASSVQRDVFEVERVFESGKKERGVLEILENEVVFVELETGERRRISWAFKYIRRFGHEGDNFTLEVGRRAPGGAGLHNFKTAHPADLNAAVKSASMSGRGTPPSPQMGESGPRSQVRSFTPPSQRHPPFNTPGPPTPYPPPLRAAPLPPTPSQLPTLPIPPSPPQPTRNSAYLHHHHSQLPPAKNSTSGGGFSRSDSLLRRAFSAADLRMNVFEVKNISDDKKEVGQGTLEVTMTDLVYVDARTNEKWRWPFKFLRKYGYEKNIFSFEAGRRCPGGQGLYAFSSDRASEIHETIVTNIQGGKKQKEEHDRKKSQATPSNAEHSHVPKSMPKSQSRYSFTEEQAQPASSLVKLTNKNHYNIDTSLHALMQTRPLPAEPSEGAPPPPSYPVPLPVHPTPSLPSHPPTHPAPPPTHPAPPPTHPAPPPTHPLKMTSTSPPAPKFTSPSPPLSAQPHPSATPMAPVPSPMQLVKPDLRPVKQQPLIREHHYDVPDKYGANSKDSKKLKQASSSNAKSKKSTSVTSPSEKVSMKKRGSKSTVTENMLPQQSTETSKESKSKFRSLLKKKKSKRASIDILTGSPLPNGTTVAAEGANGAGVEEPRGMYVNVKLGSLQRMKKSISCDDLLSSCEVANKHSSESAVPLPQLFSSQTPPAQRRQTNTDLSSPEIGLIYQNLQDTKTRGDRSYSNAAGVPTTTEDSSTPKADQAPLYTNFEIMSETEAPPPQRVIAYAEVDIRQTSPPRTGPPASSSQTHVNGSYGMLAKAMPPLLKQAILQKGPKKMSPNTNRNRSQSLIPSPTHEVETNSSRHRSQSEVAPEENSASAAAVMDVLPEVDNSQRFERVLYAPLDFAVMDAVAEIHRGHTDIRNFDELLERHDIRVMEAEGRKR